MIGPPAGALRRARSRVEHGCATAATRRKYPLQIATHCRHRLAIAELPGRRIYVQQYTSIELIPVKEGPAILDNLRAVIHAQTDVNARPNEGTLDFSTGPPKTAGDALSYYSGGFARYLSNPMPFGPA
ncbi:MAG: hypothetical protein HYY38_02330 [Rhodospirillales bacterium]|nr:hypothetical protein [Rhodospirillales bacterium]